MRQAQRTRLSVRFFIIYFYYLVVVVVSIRFSVVLSTCVYDYICMDAKKVFFL